MRVSYLGFSQQAGNCTYWPEPKDQFRFALYSNQV